MTRATVAVHELTHAVMAGIAMQMLAPKQYGKTTCYISVKEAEGEFAPIIGHPTNPLSKPVTSIAALGPLLLKDWGKLPAGSGFTRAIAESGLSTVDVAAYTRCPHNFTTVIRALSAGSRLWKELPIAKLTQILSDARINSCDELPLELLVPKVKAEAALSAADRAYKSSSNNPYRRPSYV